MMLLILDKDPEKSASFIPYKDYEKLEKKFFSYRGCNYDR